MIKNIQMNNFRLFKDLNLILGKRITVIAGKNAVGKSNLLGVLGNSVELKKSKPLLQKQYRTEFGDLFKGSLDFDPPSSNKYRVNFCDDNFSNITDYRDFRIAWQNNNTRFRLIPNRKLEGGKKTEAKVTWPTLYLGLGRLFPIGDAENEDINATKLKLTEEELFWFKEKYSSILTLSNETVNTVAQIDINSNSHKKGIGINTDTYDYLTNSAGQDNIGQILCSLISFRRLRHALGEEYTGGLFLIDEIDATLHPLAQNRLFNLLNKEAKENQIQVAFTTHSMSLLEYITTKTYHNSYEENINNDIEIMYLTKDNDILEVERNPSYNYIRNELLLESIIHAKNKIKIYVEDLEAEWFLKNLLGDFLGRLDIKVAKLGADSLIRLNEVDIEYFSSVIICLDGDVPQDKIDKFFSRTKRPINIIRLPGDFSPEIVMYNYLLNMDGEHEFLSKSRQVGFTKNYFRDKGPSSYPGDLSQREKNEVWFNDHLSSFESFQLYDYWEVDNQDLVDRFNDEYKVIFNNLAKNLRLPRI